MAKISLKPPRQAKFYYVLATMLNVLGLGNRSWWGYEPLHPLLHFHGEFLAYVGPLCTVTQFLYLYLNFSTLSFDVISTVASIIPVSMVVNINIRSSKMAIYKKVMEKFTDEIHVSNYVSDLSDYMKQKLIWVERVSHFTAYYLMLIFGLNWLIWINIPMMHNFTNKEKIFNKTMRLQTCVYMWMPFDYGYNYKNWTIIHLINVYIVLLGVSIMATLHCLNYILIYHLIGHVQILKYNIKSSFQDDISDEEVKSRLIKIIKHHAFITRIFADVQSAFGVNVAANYLHNLFSDSLILYQVLNRGEIVSYLVMVCAYMGELVLMSFVMEEIRKQSADLPDAVYSIPWESMTVTNQKIVLLILSRVQTEMQFVALGGLRAGVKPMVSILKTSFSYYVMLKEFAGVET